MSQDSLEAFKVAAQCLDHIQNCPNSVDHQFFDNLIEQSRGEIDTITWTRSAPSNCEKFDLQFGDCLYENRPWRTSRIKITFDIPVFQGDGEARFKRDNVVEAFRPRGAQENAPTAQLIRGMIKTFSRGGEYLSRHELKEVCRDLCNFDFEQLSAE